MSVPNPVNAKVYLELVLTAEEFRIVTAALKSGADDVPLKEEFREPARKLQDRLFRAKNHSVRVQMENLQRLEESSHDYEAGPPKPPQGPTKPGPRPYRAGSR